MVFPAAIEGLKSLAYPFIQPLFIQVLYVMIQSLSLILNAWTSGDRINDEKELNTNPTNPGIYDFIIVGAGSAGSLLANRLSRRGTVLLLEAGGEPNPLQFIPAMGYFLLNFPQVDWSYRSVPQRFGSLISVNQESSWSAGLGLGGSGNLNLMIHLRGHRRDFDNWANIVGDTQWNWEGVREYFKRYEDYEIRGDFLNHGYNGDLRIEAPAFVGRAWEFVRAGAELGYPNVDLNAPFSEGFDVLRYPIRRGVRQAPYKAFLEPIRSRQSLTIVKFAHVNKVLFRNGNIAYGVEYERHGRIFTAHARLEVVLSAGTMGTPKILMLSGVGPRSHLEELNIPVVSDLAGVGENLMDHLAVLLGPFYIRQGLGTFIDRDYTPSVFVNWFALGQDRLTSTSCEAVGLISSELAKAKGEGDWPDLGLFLVSLTNFRLGSQTISRVFNFKQDEVHEYLRNGIGRDSVYIILQGSRPLSRGFIRLGGRSPYDRPVIDPNYLGDPEQYDVRVLLDGLKKSMTLMENTTYMRTIVGSQFTDDLLPGCAHLPARSDEYFLCFIRRFSVTLHHPTGTAAMGSVVDSNLNVRGVRNLRVVDASVQPVIVISNTQASTLMIAEKAADLILNTYSQVPTPLPPPSPRNITLPDLLRLIFTKVGTPPRSGVNIVGNNRP